VSDLGAALRRMRGLRRIKQSHVGEMLGVSQTTVSRWESGAARPDEAQAAALRRLLSAPLAPGHDAALRRLVETSSAPVHLICDLTHRLLAASPARAVEWRASASDFLGRPLFPYASPEIREHEARLEALGWYDLPEPRIVFDTGPNADPVMRILPGRMMWERVVLADGSVARLVTTLSRGAHILCVGPGVPHR
jgi:transcriptional regulator with XRE-family HTH domain